MTAQTVVVAGAGNIGCFLGGWLQAAGCDVRLLGRARIVAELQASGLHVSDCDGAAHDVGAERVQVTDDPAVLAQATLVLVTVKSGATAEMAQHIAQFVAPGVRVVSLQNGVGNVAVLRSLLPQHPIVAGMVPFNVVALGEGRFYRATGGELVIEEGSDWAGALFRDSGIATHGAANMESVAWGKLLINLNNALNALCGLPLAEQLSDRGWRRILAASMSEALAALAAAGIVPVRATPISPRVLPWVMRTPNWMYRRLTRRQLRIDPKARSSMWDDLERRRTTEIAFLQGAVVELAHKVGLRAPTNQRVLELIRQAEAKQAGSPHLRPEQVRT